nr:hypothetical protein [Cryobacterium sp. Hb1]
MMSRDFLFRIGLLSFVVELCAEGDFQQCEYFVGDVAFEAADDVAVGEAFSSPPGNIGRTGFFMVFAKQHDAVHGYAGLPVTTARETEALPCSGGCWYRCDAAEGCELILGSNVMSIVSGGGEQVGGNEWADSACGHEGRVLTNGEDSELLVDMGNVCRQRLVALREPFRGCSSYHLRIGSRRRTCARESDRQFGAVKATKILSDCLGRADQQSVDLIDARGACLGG